MEAGHASDACRTRRVPWLAGARLAFGRIGPSRSGSPSFTRAALLIASAPVLASPLPAPPPPALVRIADNRIASSIGVGVHALQDVPGELDEVAAAGFKLVRVDVTWSTAERSPGDFDWSATDTQVKAIAARGMQPLLILAYSNGLYEPALPSSTGLLAQVKAPAQEASRAAYARFAARTASHYRPYLPMLELWNEPNADGSWPPKASSSEYLALAGAACAAIRRAVPDAEVIAPGLANMPGAPALDASFATALGRSPLISCLDAVSVHPYLFMGVFDQALTWWSRFRATLGPASRKPLIASEWGLSTYSGRLNEIDQASYLVRMAVYDTAANVRATVWYDWRDDGLDPDNPEHHFGMIGPDGRRKPVYVAMRTMTRALGSFARLCFLRHGAEVRAIFFGNGGSRRMVAWDVDPSGRTYAAEERPLTILLPAGARLNAVRDMFGRPASTDASPGQVRTTSGQAPFYVDYAGPLPGECGRRSPGG